MLTVEKAMCLITGLLLNSRCEESYNSLSNLLLTNNSVEPFLPICLFMALYFLILLAVQDLALGDHPADLQTQACA